MRVYDRTACWLILSQQGFSNSTQETYINALEFWITLNLENTY